MTDHWRARKGKSGRTFQRAAVFSPECHLLVKLEADPNSTADEDTADLFDVEGEWSCEPGCRPGVLDEGH